MSTTHIELAVQTQEKLEFYFLSLVFTLLALSVQTAKFTDSSLYANGFELIGWACLLVSGLAGLWRMEFIPVQHSKIAKRHEIEEQIIKFEEFKMRGAFEVPVLLTGSIENINLTLKNNREALVILDQVISKLENSNFLKYKTHKYSFIIGLFFILLSRGDSPFSTIVMSIMNKFSNC